MVYISAYINKKHAIISDNTLMTDEELTLTRKEYETLKDQFERLEELVVE